MPSHEAFLKFLRLEPGDFDFLDRYRPVLQQGAESFAASFYKYLFDSPETATVLYGKKLDMLVEAQAIHFERLLTDRFRPHYQEYVQDIGETHQRLGVSPGWLAGSYSLYKEHLDFQANSSGVSPEDRSKLRQVLSKIVFADLSLQLQGYASAQSEEDATRAALTRVLIDTILMGGSSGTWDSLLRRMCSGLVSKHTHIVAAWAAIDAGSHGLLLTYGGTEAVPQRYVPQHSNDPCWQALAKGEPIVMRALDVEGLGWIGEALPRASQEVGFIPFGKSDTGYAGVGIVVADYKNYFQRVGLDHFQAFSHFGDLALSLRDQSLRDPLTGLPNRALFHDRIDHALSGAGRREKLMAIGVLDLDRFKAINDQYGHAAGDMVLQQVVSRLRAAMRPTDTLARLGGDEFGLLLDDLEGVLQLESLGSRLLGAMKEPFKVEDRLVNVSASIGFTLYPFDDGDKDTLLKHADMAMYSAKTTGRDRAAVYSSVISVEANWQAQLSNELLCAIEREELLLHYQPQVDMASGVVIGAEALLRWNHPTRGLLLPGDFLDALEGGALSSRIGRYVLDRALHQALAWLEQGLALRLAVNVGARHLLTPEFIQELHTILDGYSFPANMLEIEITENTAIADMSSARDVLDACRALGITVALDDFGTGNAPLSHLQSLPADSIKIDRGFVQDILSSRKDAAIVAGVITSAQLLGLEVIAEGVESVEHGCLLLRLGCRLAQGYAIAKPMPGELIPAWARSYRGDPSWRSWINGQWRPDDYSAVITTLSHASGRGGNPNSGLPLEI